MATDTVSKPLPAYDVLEARLERERSRVLSAWDICTTVASLAAKGESEGTLNVEEALAIRAALEGLGELLESVKDTISPEEMLSPDTESRVAEVQA